MSNASKAKSCPFCSSKADGVRWYDESVNVTSVRCSKKDCIASFKSVELDVWNTRAMPALDVTQLELLMRRFCMQPHGEERAAARAAVLTFIAEAL